MKRGKTKDGTELRYDTKIKALIVEKLGVLEDNNIFHVQGKKIKPALNM